MQLTETEWPASSLAFSADDRERFVGLHISTISRSLCEARGLNKNPRGMSPEQVDEYAAVGFLEERLSAALLESLRAVCVVPPVVAYNGTHGLQLAPGQIVPPGYIIGTSDVLEIEDDYGIVLTDTKATYKSRGIDTPDTWVRKNRWDWEINTQFYALALRAAGIEVERIRFRVLFLAGDYRPVRPMRRVWTSGPLDQGELLDNYAMCWQHSREMGWL